MRVSKGLRMLDRAAQLLFEPRANEWQVLKTVLIGSSRNTVSKACRHRRLVHHHALPSVDCPRAAVPVRSHAKKS
eukprot:scaffold20416_cov30-Tisochrysis_lutea.AAC.2